MRISISSDAIDFYVNRFQKNYNGRGIFQMYYGSEKVEVIYRLINIEKKIKNKEGFKLDVTIFTDNIKISESIVHEIRPYLKYNRIIKKM
ncbi:MAG: hypothetical protein HPY57_16195 [Ignavibacteria bacterium]|nr:hypothetical protein [Ignavibacteria bacterium]